MNIEDIVSSWNTTPFLFVGSGMTRRYLGLPNWKGLLQHFVEVISDDPLAYSAYENKARSLPCPAGELPKVAELLQKDFDERWFADKLIRTLDEAGLEQVKKGVSPFKMEVANYIKQSSSFVPGYAEEITAFSSLASNSLSGVITTNYDSFLEDQFHGYTKYIGQNELIFSAVQGIAEIYKIHGSVETPESLVINERDYLLFDEKSAYLAAKLLTIFMEYPMIFMGYSISDTNILKIVRAIVNCLDSKQIDKLEERFIFVEYNPEATSIEITPFTLMIDDKPLKMRKISLANFLPLYNALTKKKSKLPVRILRRFKEELYSYTITHQPTAHLKVAQIDDGRIKDDDFALAIGRVSEMGYRGLSSIKSDEWCRNVILDDITDFSADDLLKYAFADLLKQSSGKLPIHKYLATAQNSYPEYEQYAATRTFDTIISNTYKKHPQGRSAYTSVREIWTKEKDNLEKATRMMAYLTEDMFDVDELGSVLTELFEEDVNVLQNVPSGARTNIRRLIMIYDYLKWGKGKEPSA